MFDCANVEMRELLPDFAAGTLDAPTRARVAQHVAACTECASELETLHLVRSALGKAPVVDVQRIVSALPRPTAGASGAGRSVPVRRWVDWRVAAALTTITVGALSLAVSQRLASRPDVGGPDTTVVEPVTTHQVGVQSDTPRATRTGASPRLASPTRSTAAAVAPVAQLSFGGDVSDLDDASIRALLGALDEIDRAPVAPSAEPDRTPVLPVIKDGPR